jgi:D-psicose/D-tagatose/L-ribulose 3-epimerase
MSRFVFGAHTFIWISRWSDKHLDLLDRARRLGLDCLELGLGDDVLFTPRLARKRAASLGLKLTTGPGGFWPMACDISDDDPAVRQRGLKWHRKLIDQSSELGAVAYTGALYGHPGRVRHRMAPEDEYARTAENLHRLAEYAAKREVLLVLEPMSHFRTHMVNTPEQARRLVEMAGHQNLRILLDTYHLVTEIRDYAQAISSVSKLLWGIHACENDRGVPGNGLVPWTSVFGALNERDSECFVLLETYNSSIEGFAVSRGLFGNVCPDGDAFVKKATTFLRQFATPAGR